MSFDAQVIAAYGRHLRVRDSTGTEYSARPFGRRLQLVCGDLVRCVADTVHDQVHIMELLPRRNSLSRSTTHGEPEAVVTNISQIVVVMAPLPLPDLFIVDRYLCAAASSSIAALLVMNKMDLMAENGTTQQGLSQILTAFLAAGYKIVYCSALERASLNTLGIELSGHTSVFVGQSGVGKSSLILSLVPEADITTGELDRNDEGRHTTTSSRLYDLSGGGFLIDSPGVRDFAPAIESLEPRSLGFIEVDRLATECRFQDCQHLREPGCAVSRAVATGTFDDRRYESYRRLRRLHQSLRDAQGARKKTSP